MTPQAPPSTDDELLVAASGAVRLLSMNRPRTRNGLTIPLTERLLAALAECAADSAVRAVVLTGEGGAFSSGLDFRSAMEQAGTDLAPHLERNFHGMIRAIRALPKPVIALVDGAAAGFGCDLALACDVRLGTARTRFGEIFIKRGLMPDGGGTFHLPRLVGLGNAMHLLLSGDMVGPEEALRLGLVTRLLPDDSAVSDTLEYAARLAAGPPRVHAWIKRAVYGALDGSLEDALAVEKRGQLELLRSADFLEGVAAFLEKREPSFRGE